ncbi:MAG: outer membrane beta-barrel protein [Acidiferrobacteraceae bacterium]
MRFSTKAFAVVLACLPVPASAAGVYIGAGFGAGRSSDATSNVQNNLDALAGLGVSSSAQLDTGRAAFSLFGGYQFNRYVGAELGWIDFGNYSMNGTASGSGGSAAFSETDKISAFWLAAVGTFPINRELSVLAKAGLANSQDKESCAVSGSACAPASDSATQPMFGVGLALTASRHIGFRLEYDQYDNIGNNTHEYTAGTFYEIGVSGLYRF